MGMSAIMQPEPRSFATEIKGRRAVAWAAAKGYWWGALVNEDLIPGLIRDIEATKGKQSLHELECTHRYTAIQKDTTDMKASIVTLAADVKTLVDRGRAAAWSVNWKAWALVGVLIAGLIGALAWEASQLYALEPLRVQHETKK